MSKSLSKHLTGAGLALVFCGVVLSLRGIGLWHGHYSGGGAIYTLNNCLKLTFFALACWQFYAVGRFILGKWRVESALWQGVVSLLCGMGIVSITMHVLGLIHVMFFPVVFISSLAVTALSGSFFYDAVAGARKRIAALWKESIPGAILSIVLWSVAGAIFLYVAMAKGIYPDVITMDTVGHYMPFFRDSLSAGGLDIFPYVYNYYTSKGAGLYFFFAALTDVQSLQLASLTAILLICLILAAVVRDLGRGPAYLAPAAVVVFLSVSNLFVLEFQKQHAMVAGLIFGLWYVLMQLSRNAETGRTAFFTTGVVTAVNLATVLPAASMAIAAPLAFLATVVCLWTRLPRRRSVSFLLAVTLLAPLVLWLVNYAIFGLADLNPGHFFFNLRDDVALARHIDPSALRFCVSHLSYDGHVASSAGFILARLLQVNPLAYWWSPQLPPLWLVVPAFLLAAWRLRRAGSIGAFTWTVAGGAFFLLFMAYALNLAVKQESFALSRMGFFVYAPMVMLYALAAVAVCRAVEDRLALNVRSGVVQGVAALAMILLALARFPHNLGNDARETLEFFTGKASYEQRYSRTHVEVPACLAFSRITQQEPVYPLFYAAGCYGLPDGTYRAPYFSSLDKQFKELISGDAGTQERLFRAENYLYFIVNLKVPPTVYMYLPIFSPHNIQQRFKLVAAYDENIFLLRLDGPDDSDAMAKFLQRYAQYREAHASGPEAGELQQFLKK